MDKDFFERTEEDHSRWEGAPKERKLQSRININRDATDHDSFSMRIRIQNIIAAEEAEDDEVRLVLQTIFFQQGKLLKKYGVQWLGWGRRRLRFAAGVW